jgi:glycosyltransferase involved in cell wall biosynthesis
MIHTALEGLRVVACIPCFNTEKHIGDVVARTKKYVDKVIVINDGSHDTTTKAARDAGATVISHAENMGYGEAINSCLKAAREEQPDILIIIDGDGQHNADEIPRLLEPIIKENASIVIGSRFLDGLNMPHYRSFGIGVITYLWNFGSKTKVTDSQSGFRAYTKDAYEILTVSEQGMSCSIEILEQARRAKLIIKEVPITCTYEKSFVSQEAIKHGILVAIAVLKIRAHKRCTRE